MGKNIDRAYASCYNIVMLNSEPKFQANFRLFLQDELIRRTKKNPRYSLRSFAKSIGCDVSSLAKILSGKRAIGRITIMRLSSRLGLSAQATEIFLSKHRETKKEPPIGITADYATLAADTFHVVSDWYYYAILELIQTDDFRAESKWISRVLGITSSEANIAIERLLRLGMIEVDSKTGHWKEAGSGRLTTLGNRFTNHAFQNLQRQVLEKAILALDEVPIELRDQSSMTMAIDIDKLEAAREKIKTFRRELAAFLSRGQKQQEVYNLSISMYPVTQIRNLKKEAL